MDRLRRQLQERSGLRATVLSGFNGRAGRLVKSHIKNLIRLTGFDVVRYRPPPRAPTWPPDVSEEDQSILGAVAPFSMTSVERLLALVHAVRYIVRSGVPGAIVECGVWKGGSMMAVAHTLLQEREDSRDLYLFDTFEGMTDPTQADRTMDNTLARTT